MISDKQILAKRLEDYWKMYTVAEGLNILMTAEEIKDFNYKRPGEIGYIPIGICEIIWNTINNSVEIETYPELMDWKPPIMYSDLFWFTPGNWEVRADILLKVIKNLALKINKKTIQR